MRIFVIVYLHVTLFRIHERDKTTEVKFYFAIQMDLEHVLAQKIEQRNEWIAEVFTINECVCGLLQKQETPR